MIIKYLRSRIGIVILSCRIFLSLRTMNEAMNNRPLFLLYFVSAFLLSTGCDHCSTIVMDRAEAMMTEHPDSSLHLLEQIQSEQLRTARTKARYALLKTIALDKNYIDVADDSLSRAAYEYYQNHGNKSARMKSTYYLGVIEENGGNLIDAAIHFKEAETLAEQLQDNHFLGLACQHLSGIFARNYDHNEALKYALSSASAFYDAKEIVSARFSMIDAARQYIRNDDYYSAKAIVDSLPSHDKYTTAALYYHQLFLKSEVYIAGHDYDNALILLNQAIQSGYALSVEGKGIFSYLLEREGDASKADSLLQDIVISTQIDSAVYYNYVQNILYHRKDYKGAYESLRLSTEMQNKSIISLMDRSITHSLKNYFESRYIIEKEKASNRLFIILLIVSLLVSLTIVAVHLIRKKNKQLIRDMSIIDDIKTDLITLQDHNKGLSTVIHSLMQDKINVMQQLSDTYFQWSDDSIANREKKEGKILKEDAISQFRFQIKQLRGDTHFLEDIEKALDDSNNGIMKRLRSNTTLGDHALKEIDYNLLTLLFAGFPIKSISFLMNMTESSVRTRKTRYKQWFQKKDDADSKLFAQWLS